eukprot:m51a1_g8506 hypothetical protein (695) ;mRNA; f:67251-70213
MNWFFGKRRNVKRAIVTSLPRAPSGSVAPEDDSCIPVTEDLLLFVEDLCDHASTFTEFPVDPDKCRKFVLGPEEERHAIEVIERVEALTKLHEELVPSRRTDREFWWIYFTLIRQHFKIAPRKAAPVELVSVSSPVFAAALPQTSQAFSAGGLSQGASLVAPVSLAAYSSSAAASAAASAAGAPPPLSDAERARVLAKMVGASRELAAPALKNEVRKSPTHSRAKLWLFVTGASLYCSEDGSYWEDTMRRVLGSAELVPLLDLVDFGGGAFREEDHALREEESTALRNVLFALAAEQSEDAFLPFAPDLVSVLLRAMPAAKAFNVASVLVACSMVHGTWFPTTRKGHARDLAAFERSIARHAPQIYAKMCELEVDVSEFAAAWFDRLFAGFVPNDLLGRVADCFFTEGRVVLYRVGIALLQLALPALLAAATPQEFLAAANASGKSLENAVRLLQVAFEVPVDNSEVEVCTAGREAHSRLLRAALAVKIPPNEGAEGVVEIRPDGTTAAGPAGAAAAAAAAVSYDDFLRVENPSTILSQRQFELLCDWLPSRLVAMDPVLLFTTARDGCALSRLFHQCEGRDSLVLVVETTSHNVFGVFIPTELTPSPGRYYGTGESFLFAMTPTPEKYEWEPGNKSYFMNIEHRSISFGGGGLMIDDELNEGSSQACDTYHNKPLNYGSEDFEILHLEVVTFE